jgi:UrcA family protein
MKPLFSIALAIAVMGACETASADQVAKERAISVGYLDLDIGTPNGRATLQRRVDLAVKRVCGQAPSPRQIGRVLDHKACLTGAKAGAQAQVAALFRNMTLAHNEVRVTSGN